MVCCSEQHLFLKLFSGSQHMKLQHSLWCRQCSLLSRFKYLQNKDIQLRQLLKSLFSKAADYHRELAISMKLIISSQCKCQKYIMGSYKEHPIRLKNEKTLMYELYVLKGLSVHSLERKGLTWSWLDNVQSFAQFCELELMLCYH